MQRLFKCLLGPAFTTLTFAVLATAQTQQPAQSAPASAQPPKSSITLHAGTQLVVVDVVVTDKNRKPVHGLKQTEFILNTSYTRHAAK